MFVNNTVDREPCFRVVKRYLRANEELQKERDALVRERDILPVVDENVSL